MVRGVDAARLSERPEPNGWSVSQVLEHLCVTDEAHAVPLAALFRSARADAAAPAREWRPSFLGKQIARALERPKLLKAPKAFQPRPTARNGVAEACLARESAFVQMMDDAASLDWNALRIGSPALPRWVPKMNLGDVFRIHVVHVNRHTRKIERLIAKL